jgi:hypothetical protein
LAQGADAWYAKRAELYTEVGRCMGLIDEVEALAEVAREERQAVAKRCRDAKKQERNRVFRHQRRFASNGCNTAVAKLASCAVVGGVEDEGNGENWLKLSGQQRSVQLSDLQAGPKLLPRQHLWAENVLQAFHNVLKTAERVQSKLSSPEHKGQRGLFALCGEGESYIAMDSLGAEIRSEQEAFARPWALSWRAYTARLGPGTQPLPGIAGFWAPHPGQDMLACLFEISELVKAAPEVVTSTDMVAEAMEAYVAGNYQKPRMVHVRDGQVLWTPMGWMLLPVGAARELTTTHFMPWWNKGLWEQPDKHTKELVRTSITQDIHRKAERRPWCDIGTAVQQWLAQ